MLRQLWRQRGAYNVVNLPFAASQDDPGSSTGRADRSSDWRRHYNPALEPEFREDVGLDAWDRPNWYTDKGLSSTAAAKILRKRLETYGPQKERNLQEVFARIRSEGDAIIALKAAELFRRYRSSREQHSPFKSSTSKMIVQRALDVNAGDVAVQALARKDELGFNFISLKAYRHAITHFSSKGDLKNVIKVFDLAKKQGMKPNRDVAFCILRACLDCNRPELAFAYAIEFSENGLRISPAQRVKIEAESGKRLPPQVEDIEDSSENSPAATVATDVPSVSKEADRIIAAASAAGSTPAEDKEEQPESPVASVSSMGEGETVVNGGEVVPEAAVSEGEAQPSKAAGGARIVAALSVDLDPDDIVLAASKATKTDRPTEEAFDVKPAEIPGLEDAVAAKMRLLFPPKPTKEHQPELRRANSL